MDEDLEYEWIREQVWVKMEKEAQLELDLKEEFKLKPAKIEVRYDDTIISKALGRDIEERV